MDPRILFVKIGRLWENLKTLLIKFVNENFHSWLILIKFVNENFHSWLILIKFVNEIVVLGL